MRLSRILSLFIRFCFLFSLFLLFENKQEARLKKQEEIEKAAAAAQRQLDNHVHETDDERDDLEEDIEVTHF